MAQQKRYTVIYQLKKNSMTITYIGIDDKNKHILYYYI